MITITAHFWQGKEESTQSSTAETVPQALSALGGFIDRSSPYWLPVCLKLEDTGKAAYGWVEFTLTKHDHIPSEPPREWHPPIGELD